MNQFLFVVAGTHAEYTRWRNDNKEFVKTFKGVRYLSHVNMLFGLNPLLVNFVFVGTAIERQDYTEIQEQVRLIFTKAADIRRTQENLENNRG